MSINDDFFNKDFLNEMKLFNSAVTDLTKSFKNNNSGNSSSTYSKIDKSIDKFSDFLDGKITNFTNSSINSFKILTGSADQFTNAVNNLTTGLLKNIPLIGGAFALAYNDTVGYIGKLVDNYKQLSDVGQGYGQSLLDIAANAAQAGLSMNEYTNLIRKNSITVASMKGGSTEFANLAKNVRKTAIQFGDYGYTVDQLNDLTGEYTNRMRMYAQLNSLNSIDAVKSINDLAKETTLLSSVFGKSREEITKTTTKAMQNTQYITHAASFNNAADREKFVKETQETIAAFGAINGFGEELADFAAATKGGKGLTWATDFGKLTGPLGFTDLPAIMEKYVNKPIDPNNSVAGNLENATDAHNFLVKYFNQNGRMDALNNQALTDPVADKLAKMVSQLGPIIEKNADYQKKLAQAQAQDRLNNAKRPATDFLTSFNDRYQLFSTDIQTKFFNALQKPLGKLSDKIFGNQKDKNGNEIANSSYFDIITNKFSSYLDVLFGDNGLLGKALNSLTMPGGAIEQFTNWLVGSGPGDQTSFLGKISTTFNSWFDDKGQIDWKKIGDSFLDGLGTVIASMINGAATLIGKIWDNSSLGGKLLEFGTLLLASGPLLGPLITVIGSLCTGPAAPFILLGGALLGLYKIASDLFGDSGETQEESERKRKALDKAGVSYGNSFSNMLGIYSQKEIDTKYDQNFQPFSNNAKIVGLRSASGSNQDSPLTNSTLSTTISLDALGNSLNAINPGNDTNSKLDAIYQVLLVQTRTLATQNNELIDNTKGYRGPHI